MRTEKINVVLNCNALHGLFAKRTALLRHRLFVREEPPKPGANQSQHDDEQNNYLAG